MNTKIQMVCGVPCTILEKRIEQGIFWQNGVLSPLPKEYRLVVRPDTGELLMTFEKRNFGEIEPFMRKHARSLRRLARKLAKEGV